MEVAIDPKNRREDSWRMTPAVRLNYNWGGPAKSTDFFRNVLKAGDASRPFLWAIVSDKRIQSGLKTSSSTREIAAYLNRALDTADLAMICQAVGDAIRLHNVADLAKEAGLKRTSLYRAFGGRQSPNLSTVLAVLHAMGFKLQVAQRKRRKSWVLNARKVQNPMDRIESKPISCGGYAKTSE